MELLEQRAARAGLEVRGFGIDAEQLRTARPRAELSERDHLAVPLGDQEVAVLELRGPGCRTRPTSLAGNSPRGTPQ